jgi:hypothetical protein
MKSEYLSRFKIAPQTREQGLATEIYESFHRKLPFPRIMAIIQRTGWQATFEAWKASTGPKVKKPIALFLWKSGQNAKAVKFEGTHSM